MRYSVVYIADTMKLIHDGWVELANYMERVAGIVARAKSFVAVAKPIAKPVSLGYLFASCALLLFVCLSSVGHSVKRNLHNKLLKLNYATGQCP